MKFKYLFLTALSLSVLISCVGKKHDRPISEGSATTKNTADVSTIHNYEFTTQTGLSTVNIGRASDLIYAFRRLNNAVNDKKPANITQSVTDFYENKIKSALSPSLSDIQQKEAITDFISKRIEELENFIASADFSKNVNARPGVAGRLDIGGGDVRLLNANGVQLGQVIQKSLIGALQLSSINYYLDEAVKADDNLVPGQNYTNKEHFWDVAYGFLGTREIDPSRRLADIGLSNYIRKEAVGQSGLEGIDIKILNAFYYGRLAIVQHNNAEMLKQKELILNLLSRLIVLRCKFYLKEASLQAQKFPISASNPDYFNTMAEALGFISALPFASHAQNIPDVQTAISYYNSLVDQKDGLWNREGITGVAAGSVSDILQKLQNIKVN